MKRYLLFATTLYALPILRPIAQAIAAAGGESAWFVSPALNGYMRDDETVFRDLAQIKAYDPYAVMSASNWVPHFFPGIKVQIFHGFNVNKRDPDRGHFRIRGLFDLYCTQGPATTQPFQLLAERHGHFAVIETGWPKLDPLFDASAVPASLPAANGRKVCMYAATFTRNLSSARALYDQIAQQVASGEHYWLLTLHPKAERDLVAQYRALGGPNARFFEAPELTSMLSAADVLVSDTSSVISEFIVQRKPVVTFRNRAPQSYMIDIQLPQQLAPALRDALNPSARLVEEIEASAEQTHPFRDGASSRRVLAAIDDFHESHLGQLRRKPLNLLRKLQARLNFRRWLSDSMRA